MCFLQFSLCRFDLSQYFIGFNIIFQHAPQATNLALNAL